MPTADELFDVLGYITVIGGLVSLFVFLYEVLTTENQKQAHKSNILSWLESLKKTRSLELAQNDALLALKFFDFIYGPKERQLPVKFGYFQRSNWIYRPITISFIIACLYIVPLQINFLNKFFPFAFETFGTEYNSLERFLYFLRYIVIFIPINALLDLVSVNTSRYLFFRMSQSPTIKLIFGLLLADVLIATAFYFVGPLWVAIEYILGPQFWSMLDYRISRFPYFFSQALLMALSPIDTIRMVLLPIPMNTPVFLLMFATTFIPTFIHFSITVVFVVSKVLVEPTRIVTQSFIDYTIKLPKGVTALVSFTLTILTVFATWFLLMITNLIS